MLVVDQAPPISAFPHPLVVLRPKVSSTKLVGAGPLVTTTVELLVPVAPSSSVTVRVIV